jgi:exodeoxyribonuclease III
MRVMTYNLLHGGEPDRRDAIGRVVAGQRPDVLALQELAGWDRSGGRIAREFAAGLGMRAYLARSLVGQPVALLVRDDVRVERARAVRRPLHHAAMLLRIATDRGPLTVLGAHLYPWSGRRRLWEARWLAAALRADLAGAGSGLGLLMGDLNSLDPWTEHAAQLAELPSRYRSRHLRRDGRADVRAIATLGERGLVDVFRRTGSLGRDYTAPSEGPGGTEFSRLRLDYVLATAPVAETAVSCRVLDEGEAATSSDHYPVVADFKISLDNKS